LSPRRLPERLQTKRERDRRMFCFVLTDHTSARQFCVGADPCVEDWPGPAAALRRNNRCTARDRRVRQDRNVVFLSLVSGGLYWLFRRNCGILFTGSSGGLKIRQGQKVG